MAFCDDHGIPHSIFLGRVWPNPDDPQEPYWLDEDAEKASVYRDATAEVCQGCGTRAADWVDEITGHPLEKPLLYADTHRCHGCAELEMARSTIPDKANGVRAILRRVQSRTAEHLESILHQLS